MVEVCTGYPPDRVGGAERVVSCIREGLVPGGNRVVVLTRFWKRAVPDPGIIQVRTSRSELAGYVGWGWQAYRKVSEIRPDLLHCHGLEGAIVCILTKFKPFPRVMHVHNSLTRESGYLSSFVHRLGLWALELAILLADVVVVPTEVVKEDTKRHIRWVSPDKIRVLPNPVTQSPPPSAEELKAVKEQLGIGTRRAVVYFGKIKRTKGLEDLCEAYEMMRQKQNAALVIAGAPTATDRFLEGLKTKYRDVLFTGFVPDPEPYYRLADLFCIYTKGFEGGETFAISLAEALLKKVPVVCADNPIFREVTGGNAIFVSPADPHALAAALDDALSDPPSLAGMVQGGYEFASERYVPRVFVERTESIYREAIARKTQRVR